MHYIGIDPGTQGALCSLETGHKEPIIEFMDTPDSKDLGTSIPEVYGWLITHPVNMMAIEDVHSLYGMSAKSNFQFGRNLGYIEALAHLWLPMVDYVQPKVWQRECGIVFPKKSTPKEKKLITVLYAIDIYPNAVKQLYGPKGGLKDGRADALMIAHYLRLIDERRI